MRTITRLFALCAIALSTLLSGFAARAQPEASAPRVRIQRPLQGDPLIDEAVIRILGELSAVGLDVEVLHRSEVLEGELPPLEAGTHGLLAIRRESQWIELDTWAPDGGKPYSQHVDASSPQTNAEVIAVRAVEALRAKWLEYGELSDATLPEEVREFTRIDSSPPAPSPAPNEEPAPPRPIEPSPRSTTPSVDEQRPGLELPPLPDFDTERWMLQLSLGPSLALEGAAGNNLGLRGVILFGRSGLFAGGGMGSDLQRPRVASPAGSADFDRTRYMAVIRGEVQLGNTGNLYLMGGVGLARFAINASVGTAPGLVARDSIQHRVAGALQLGSTFWLTGAFGVFAEAEAEALDQAMVIRMDEREVYTFGGPTLALGLGLTLRQPIER